MIVICCEKHLETLDFKNLEKMSESNVYLVVNLRLI